MSKARRDQILIDLYNTGYVQKQSELRCKRFNLIGSQLEEDITQEIFQNLMDFPIEKFLEIYDNNVQTRPGFNNSIITLVNNIFRFKIHSFNQINPSRSFLRAVTYNSAFHTLRDKVENDKVPQLPTRVDMSDAYKEYVSVEPKETIYSEFYETLSNEEKEFLERISNKGVGRYKTSDKIKLDSLKTKAAEFKTKNNLK